MMNNFNFPILNAGPPQPVVMNPISIEDLLTLDPSTTVFFYPLHQGDIPNINGNAFHVPGTTIAIFYNMPRDGPMNILGNPVVLSLLNMRQALDLAVVMANGQINRLASGMEEAPAAVPATAPIPAESDAVVAQQDAPVLGDDEGMVDEPIAELAKDPASSRDKLRLRISPDLTSVKVTNEHGVLIQDDVPAGPSRENEDLENQKEEHAEALAAVCQQCDENVVKASALQVQLTAAQEDLETEKAKSEALEKQAEDLKTAHKEELDRHQTAHKLALSSEETKHKNELEVAMQKIKEEVEKKQQAEKEKKDAEEKLAKLKDQLREESEVHEKALQKHREQMRDQDVAHSAEITEAIEERDEKAWKASDLEKKLKAVIENPESKVQELLGAALQEQKTQLEAAIEERLANREAELLKQYAMDLQREKDQMNEANAAELKSKVKESEDNADLGVEKRVAQREAELEDLFRDAQTTIEQEVERRLAVLKKDFDRSMKYQLENEAAQVVERVRDMEAKNQTMMQMERVIRGLEARIQMLQNQLAAQNTRSSSRGVSPADTTNRRYSRQGTESRPATSNDVQVMVVSSGHQSPPAPTLPEDSEASEAPTTTLPEAAPEHAARPELADDWEQATDVRKN